MGILTIETGSPPGPGVYVGYTCGILGGSQAVLVERRRGEWYFVNSSEQFDSLIFGWIGPLPAFLEFDL